MAALAGILSGLLGQPCLGTIGAVICLSAPQRRCYLRFLWDFSQSWLIVIKTQQGVPQQIPTRVVPRPLPVNLWVLSCGEYRWQTDPAGQE